MTGSLPARTDSMPAALCRHRQVRAERCGHLVHARRRGFAHPRVQRRLVDQHQAVDGLVQMMGERDRLARGIRHDERDDLDAEDLGLFDGLGQVVVPGDEVDDLGGPVPGLRDQVQRQHVSGVQLRRSRGVW
ncbi:MAG: hypothetical protein ACT4P1_03240 [Sporichthyaceae bacterium]